MGKENCPKCGGKGYNIEEVTMKKMKRGDEMIGTGKMANRHCWDCDGRGYIKVKDKKEEEK